MPPATKSFALICHDFDVPSRGDDVNQTGPRGAGRPAARRLLPLGDGRSAGRACARSREGEFSRGFTPRGKRGPMVDACRARARAPRPERLHRLVRRRPGRWPASTSATTGRSRRSTIRWCTTTCSRCMRSTSRGCRSRAPSPAPRCARRSPGQRAGRGDALGHLHAQPQARRLSLASRRTPSHAHHRRPPWRDGLERRHAHPGPARHPAQRDRALAGRNGSAQALADEPLAAVYSSDLARAHETARADRPRRRHAGGRATPACASAASACSRARPSTRSSSTGPRRRCAGASAIPTSAPEGGESLRGFCARASAPPRDLAARHPGRAIALVAHGGVLDCLYRVATAQEVNSPRTWQLANGAHQPAALDAEGFTLVGWSDTQHLDQAARRGQLTLPLAGRAPAVRRRPRHAAASRRHAPWATGRPRRHARARGRPRRDGAQPRAHGRVRAQARHALAAARQDAQERGASRGCRWQAGAVGVCVQKTAEAEAHGRRRRRDIYISNEVVDAGQAGAWRARAPARGDGGRLAIAVDSERRHRSACAATALRARGAARRSTCSSRSTSARAAAACRRAAAGRARARDPQARGAALRRPAGLSRQGAAPARRGRARGRDRGRVVTWCARAS